MGHSLIKELPQCLCRNLGQYWSHLSGQQIYLLLDLFLWRAMCVKDQSNCNWKCGLLFLTIKVTPVFFDNGAFENWNTSLKYLVLQDSRTTFGGEMRQRDFRDHWVIKQLTQISKWDETSFICQAVNQDVLVRNVQSHG